ncbi:MAG TPA: universal stress protein, partial [Longimicrobium sp.]|nr:universal stress protein [Longimicrobium sp.]
MHAPIRAIVAGIATVDDGGDPILDDVLALALRTGADLHLVHAFTVSAEALEVYTRMGYHDPDCVGIYEEGLQAKLESEVRARTQRDRIFCHALHMAPALALAEAAATLDAGLIVIGAARPSALAAPFVRTTATRLFRIARVPVLVLDRIWPEGAPVVAATDLSDLAPRAFERGVPLARALSGRGAPVRALHVSGEADAGARLAAFIAEHAPAALPVTAVVQGGDPAREIVAACDGAGLLVLGTHGRRGLERLVPGSVAEAVLRTASCSVLVVPPMVLAATPPPPPIPVRGLRPAPPP